MITTLLLGAAAVPTWLGLTMITTGVVALTILRLGDPS